MNRQIFHINEYQIRHNHFWQVTNKTIIMHMKAVLVQYKSNYSKKCPYFIQIKSVIGNDAFFSFYFYQWNVL